MAIDRETFVAAFANIEKEIIHYFESFGQLTASEFRSKFTSMKASLDTIKAGLHPSDAPTPQQEAPQKAPQAVGTVGMPLAASNPAAQNPQQNQAEQTPA